MSFNGIKIDNGTSTLEETKEINILKSNFPTTHIHSTYNTQTSKHKIKVQREIWENRDYGGNLPKIYFQSNFSCPRYTLKFHSYAYRRYRKEQRSNVRTRIRKLQLMAQSH